MRILHLKEGVVTKEECKGIIKECPWSDLSLVLWTKSEEQYKVAIKTLEGYPTYLTKLTLRYLSGKHIDIYYSGYAVNNIVLHLVYCSEQYCVNTMVDE